MTYAQIALLLLKIANFFITRAHDNKLISEGEDRAIARENALILQKSNYAKRVMQDTSALNATQTDDVLKQLGAA